MRMAAELAVLTRLSGVKTPWRRKRHDGRLEALRGKARARHGSGFLPKSALGRPPEGAEPVLGVPRLAAEPPQRPQKQRRKRPPHARQRVRPSRLVDPRALQPARAHRDAHLGLIARDGSFARLREASRLPRPASTSIGLRPRLAADAASWRTRGVSTPRSART